jgi:hypothetical protein
MGNCRINFGDVLNFTINDSFQLNDLKISLLPFLDLLVHIKYRLQKERIILSREGIKVGKEASWYKTSIIEYCKVQIVILIVKLDLLFSYSWLMSKALHIHLPSCNKFYQMISKFTITVDIFRKNLNFRCSKLSLFLIESIFGSIAINFIHSPLYFTVLVYLTIFDCLQMLINILLVHGLQLSPKMI